MRINEIEYEGAKPIDGYGPGFFRLGGMRRDGGQLVLPGGASDWGGYDDLAPLLQIADEIDVLFVGTGAEIAHIPKAMREALEHAGLLG